MFENPEKYLNFLLFNAIKLLMAVSKKNTLKGDFPKVTSNTPSEKETKKIEKIRFNSKHTNQIDWL